MTRDKDPNLLADLGVFASPDVLYQGQKHRFYGDTNAITHLISTNCKSPTEAWKFMAWMASDEAAKIISVSGMIPSNLTYANSAAYQQVEPLNAQLVQLVKTRYITPAIVDPNIPQMGEITRVMVDSAQEVFITQQDPKTVLDTAAQQVKKILTK